MKNLKIEITHSGSAFDYPTNETIRLLRELADYLEDYEPPRILRDRNGNKCGTVSFSHNFFEKVEE